MSIDQVSEKDSSDPKKYQEKLAEYRDDEKRLRNQLNSAVHAFNSILEANHDLERVLLFIPEHLQGLARLFLRAYQAPSFWIEGTTLRRAYASIIAEQTDFIRLARGLSKLYEGCKSEVEESMPSLSDEQPVAKELISLCTELTYLTGKLEDNAIRVIEQNKKTLSLLYGQSD